MLFFEAFGGRVGAELAAGVDVDGNSARGDCAPYSREKALVCEVPIRMVLASAASPALPMSMLPLPVVRFEPAA